MTSVLQKYKSKRAGNPNAWKNSKTGKRGEHKKKVVDEPNHSNHFTQDIDELNLVDSSDSDEDYEEVLINLDEKPKEEKKVEKKVHVEPELEKPKLERKLTIKPEPVKKSASQPIIIKKTIKKYYNKKDKPVEPVKVEKVKEPEPLLPPSYLNFTSIKSNILKNKLNSL